MSSYFKKHQKVYYERLTQYHNGYIETWIDFYLDGVIEIAKEAIDIVAKITKLREQDRQKIQMLGTRSAQSATTILPNLYAQPIVNVALIQKWTGFTRAGAQRVVNKFVELKILVPKNKDKKYGQSYMYKEYLDIFHHS